MKKHQKMSGRALLLLGIASAALHGQNNDLAGNYVCTSMGSRPCDTTSPLQLTGNGNWRWAKYAGSYQAANGQVEFQGVGGAASWGPAIIGPQSLTFQPDTNPVVWRKPSTSNTGAKPGAYFCRTAPNGCQTGMPIEVRADRSWSWGGSGGSYSVVGNQMLFRGPQVGGWGPADIGDGTLTFHTPAGPSQWNLGAAAGSGSQQGIDPNLFDISGLAELPPFDRQRISAMLPTAQPPGATVAAKARGHLLLSELYQKAGDTKRAQEEYQRAQYWKNGGRW